VGGHFDPKGVEMADAALFLGWGTAIPGREQRSLEVFQNDVLPFFEGQRESGAIEGYDVVFLEAHGGDLSGFVLAKGSRESIATIRASEEMERLLLRGEMVVQGLGAVGATVDDGIEQGMGLYRQAVADLT
jgi:hypothetical protein